MAQSKTIYDFPIDPFELIYLQRRDLVWSQFEQIAKIGLSCSDVLRINMGRVRCRKQQTWMKFRAKWKH